VRRTQNHPPLHLAAHVPHPGRRAAHSGWPCGAFGMAVWCVWDGRVVRLGWACGAFGLGVWCVWVGRVVRLGWACGAFGMGVWCVWVGSQRRASHEVVVNLIAGTTTRTGLTVRAELDQDDYQKGIEVTDEEFKRIPLVRQHYPEAVGRLTRKVSNLFTGTGAPAQYWRERQPSKWLSNSSQGGLASAVSML
jgi:Rhodopirellula transposase DDE domain